MPKGFLQFRKTLIPGFISALLAFSFAAHAAPADTLNYQGKLSDTQGAPVADANYDFKLTLWNSQSGGTCLWSALGSCGTPTAKTLATKTGIFSTELGASGDNALDLDFNSDVYLQIQVNTDSPMTPRRKVNASAYSLNTKKLDGQDSSYYINASTEAQTKQGDLTVNGDVTVGNSSSDHLVIYGGNSSNGDITTTSGSMTLKPQAGQNLNVSLSTTGDFAVNANQLYVDTSTGNVGIGTNNPTQKLVVNGNVEIEGDAAVGNLMPKTTGSLSSSINRNNIASANFTENNTLYHEYQKFHAIGQDGYSRVIYFDNDWQDLRFIRCLDNDCVSKNTTTLNTNANGVDMPTIMMAQDGYARFVYLSYENPNQIHYIRCQNDDCSSKTETLVTSSSYGRGFWIVGFDLGADGYPRVFFEDNDGTNGDAHLKLARCLDQDCLTKNITTVVSSTRRAWFLEQSMLKMAPDGYPRIAYMFEEGPQELRYVRCLDDDCVTKNETVVDTKTVNNTLYYYYLDFVIGIDGFARLVFPDAKGQGMKFIQCIDADCVSRNTAILDTGASTGPASIVLGTDGFPRISYSYNNWDPDWDLLYAVRCLDAGCATKTNVMVDDDGGHPHSIAIGLDGLPRIAYGLTDGRTLRYARFKTASGSNEALGSSIGSASNPFGAMYGSKAYLTEASISRLEVTGSVSDLINVTGVTGTPLLRVNGLNENINMGGYVGINTLSPRSALEVNGLVNLSGTYHSVMTIQFRSDIRWESGSNRHLLKLKTRIPYYPSGLGVMPHINIKGFDYGIGKNIDLAINFYNYNGSFIAYSATSRGASAPKVSIGVESGYISILLEKPSVERWYAGALSVSVFEPRMDNPDYYKNWTYDDQDLSSATVVTEIPYTSRFGEYSAFSNDRLGIGTTNPSTLLHLSGTANTLRQGYDATNYTDILTDSSGNLAINPQGTTVTFGATSNPIAIIPAENNTAGYTIGTSANRWKQGYFVDGIVTGSSSTTYAESGVTSTYAGAYGIIPTAGEDLNIALSGSGEFKINTNQFYVDGNSGKVGIGTASPSAMFHVYGAEYVAFDRFDTFSGSHLVLRSANGTVGTPLPSQKGDKLGQVTFGGYDGSSWSAGTDVGIWSVATEDWNSGSHGSYLAFGTVADGTTYLAEHMRIDQDGKVGIGTTTPISPLEVVSTSSSAFRTVVATQYSDNQLASQFNYRKARGTSVSPQAVLSGDYLSAAYTYGFDGSDWYQTAGFKVEAEENFTSTNGGSYMRFLTTQSGSKMLTEKMRIDGSGNVGIGTSDPLEKLVVNGKVVAELYGGRKRSLSGYSLEVGGLTPTSSNNEATIYFHDWNTLMHQMAYRSGTLYWEALGDGSGNTNNTPNLSVSGSLYAALNGGRVGIGTTSPAQILHVGSSAITDGTVLIRTQDANSTCDFTAQAGGPTCGSDLRLKKDISTMTGTLDIVTRLNPVAYHWNTEASAAPLQYGFIAQEVEVLIPGLVTEGEWIDGSKKKFLSMGGMMPYVVGAIKEQQSRISANDELLDALRTETQNAFATLFSASGEQTEATSLTLGDTTLETNDTLSKKLEEQKDRITLLLRSTENNTLSLELLKTGFDNQQIQLTALMDFYTNLRLGNFLALNEKNNLILPGNLTVNDIEARVLAARAIAIRNEEGREVVGKATIIPIQVDENGDGRDDETGSDGMTVEVRTQAVEEEDNIFVTARQPIAIGVISIVDNEMFIIKAQEPVSEEVDVSWWIVGAASSESE